MPQIHVLGYPFYPFAVLQRGSDRNVTGDKQQACSSLCPGEVTVSVGRGGDQGCLGGCPPLCPPLSRTLLSSPGLCWPLSPLPPWRWQGSASLIYVTAAVFRCCHSHVRWKTWYLKSCYTSTAYAGGKTIYILKKKKKILVKKELEQDYHSVSASHPQPGQCSASPGPRFGNAAWV